MDNAPQPLATPPWAVSRAKSVAARIGLAAKVIVSAALLVFLGQKVDWATAAERLTGAAPLPLIAALLAMITTIFCAALRWRILVERAEARMPLTAAVQLTFAGMFFGQVLPATVGGDVVRAWLACRTGLPWRAVVSGVVLDRVTALLASVALIFAGLPWLSSAAAGASLPLSWTVATSVALIAVLAGGLYVDKLPLPQALIRQKWIGHGLDLTHRIRTGLLSKAGAAALALSLAIHLATVMIVVLIGRGFGIEIPPFAAFLVVPLAILAAAVPVSLNGWGVREGVMVSGFALFGVSTGDALLVSIMLGFAVVVAVLPGSLTWLALR